ncbi:MAG: hypothetical protein QOE90_1397 [Thermoplasmata archaeon]|jgi:signal transduction histidine kinase|nr:hypothetical protein [Thermoplasmata archaeon]
MAANRLEALLAQSERAAALGTLATGVAHEIRTPLSVTANHLAMIARRLERAGSLSAELADLPGHLAAAQDGMAQIAHLVEGLQRFARVDAPRELVALPEAIDEALALFRAAHPAVRLEAALAPTPPIRAARVHVQQAALHILENGAQAIGPEGTLRVATSHEADRVLLLVEDDGIGMTPDVQARMYEEFYTTKPGAPGLGLAIVRRIVEAHGASMVCRSAPDQGTRFVLSFPAYAPSRGA